MVHSINIFDVTNVTLSKPSNKGHKTFETQTMEIKSDKGNMTLTLFLK